MHYNNSIVLRQKDPAQPPIMLLSLTVGRRSIHHLCPRLNDRIKYHVEGDTAFYFYTFASLQWRYLPAPCFRLPPPPPPFSFTIIAQIIRAHKKVPTNYPSAYEVHKIIPSTINSARSSARYLNSRPLQQSVYYPLCLDTTILHSYSCGHTELVGQGLELVVDVGGITLSFMI